MYRGRLKTGGEGRGCCRAEVGRRLASGESDFERGLWRTSEVSNGKKRTKRLETTHLARLDVALCQHLTEEEELRHPCDDRVLLHRRRSYDLVPLRVVRDEVQVVRLALEDNVLPLRGLLRTGVAELLALRGPKYRNLRERNTFAGDDVLGDGAAVVLRETRADVEGQMKRVGRGGGGDTEFR